jgi:hypothetical protein
MKTIGMIVHQRRIASDEDMNVSCDWLRRSDGVLWSRAFCREAAARPGILLLCGRVLLVL